MITYDVFQPMANIAWPPFPVKAQILKPDGQFQDITFTHPNDYVGHGEAVAIKFIRPNPVTEKVNEIANAINRRGFVGREIIREVVEYMMRDEQKVDVNLPKMDERNWLMNKLDKMGYNRPRDRVAIANWYFQPDIHPTAPLDGNTILTVKKLGDFARVVVLPTGHTIAYSTAQKIWYAMNDSDIAYNFSNTTVGEFYPSSGIRHVKQHVQVNKYRVKVGCQTVDRDVIAEFAQRQGWSKTPPHGAY